MKIALQFPVEHGETTYQSVTLHRAKAKDMVVIADHLPALLKLRDDKGEANVSEFDGAVISAMIAMVSTLGSVPLEVAEELDFADLISLGTAASDFLSFGTSHGKASSPTSLTS